MKVRVSEFVLVAERTTVTASVKVSVSELVLDTLKLSASVKVRVSELVLVYCLITSACPVIG